MPTNIAASLRRPQTTDTTVFWYVSQARWDQYIDDLNDPSKARNAMAQLRKFDLSGRIMETDEGKQAPNPCYWCSRPGYGPCMVFKDRDDVVCAYCKRHSKTGCAAAIPPTDVVVESEGAGPGSKLLRVRRDVANQGVRLAQQEAVIAEQSEQINNLRQEIMVLKEIVGTLVDDMGNVWKRTYQ